MAGLKIKKQVSLPHWQFTPRGIFLFSFLPYIGLTHLPQKSLKAPLLPFG
jgi:hypothetical protein